MWIVVNIGCIECGVSSNIVGVFTSEDVANTIAKMLDDKMHWREGGQNCYEVFPIPATNQVNEEYKEALKDLVQ